MYCELSRLGVSSIGLEISQFFDVMNLLCHRVLYGGKENHPSCRTNSTVRVLSMWDRYRHQCPVTSNISPRRSEIFGSIIPYPHQSVSARKQEMCHGAKSRRKSRRVINTIIFLSNFGLCVLLIHPPRVNHIHIKCLHPLFTLLRWVDKSCCLNNPTVSPGLTAFTK